ncbi:hypothetical protein CE91St19_03550 [Odoribacter laneus]|jgi:lipoprotein|uniref:hypothetical protein n=2 Tax=Odoribacter laneus TaxID=626933 RepID=UPI00189BBE83|nr:hypothetical protein [Odoribacter laneus]MBS1446361.1 hypothetical protein [Odoribacter sp.]GKI20953.1 hypothetical protein CE91St19_03550 [Odoribacter laneus]GKI24217.1 hypothetical protein CE91St20_03540 [Odoribacter laneus]
MRKVIVIVSLVLFVTGCWEYRNTPSNHQIIRICNNSDMDIYFRQGNCEGEIFDNYNISATPQVYKIYAHECKNEYSPSFEVDMEYWCKELKLSYVFFDAKILETIPFDTVFKYNMMLGSKIFTKEQLDSLDWTITYP